MTPIVPSKELNQTIVMTLHLKVHYDSNLIEEENSY